MERAAAPIMRNLEDFAGIASDWFFEMDENLRFTYFSSRFEEVTGLEPAALIGKQRQEVRPHDLDHPRWDQHLDDLHNHRPFRNFEYCIDRPDGSGVMWIRISAEPQFDREGRFLGYRGAGHDVTPEKEAMRRLEHMNATLAKRNKKLRALKRELERAAIEDPLTGLENRRAFDAAMEMALEGEATPIALFLIDLDHFKTINDTYGHPGGDAVLIAVGERLRRRAGARSKVFRIGGDEFAVILRGDRAVGATDTLGAAMIDALRGPIDIGAATVTIGASIGYAMAGDQWISPFALMSQADAALYSAKQAGRNCIRPAARISDSRPRGAGPHGHESLRVRPLAGNGWTGSAP